MGILGILGKLLFSDEDRWQDFLRDANASNDPQQFVTHAFRDAETDEMIRTRILQTIFLPRSVTVPEWWPTFGLLFTDATEEMFSFTARVLQWLAKYHEPDIDLSLLQRFRRLRLHHECNGS